MSSPQIEIWRIDDHHPLPILLRGIGRPGKADADYKSEAGQLVQLGKKSIRRKNYCKDGGLVGPYSLQSERYLVYLNPEVSDVDEPQPCISA